eukprot:gene4175-7485_t
MSEVKQVEHQVKLEDCPIQHVTIFNSSAIVSRTLKVQLLEGEQEVIIAGLSNKVFDDSIRISGSGDALILEISTKSTKDTVKANPKDISSKKEFEIEIKQIQNEIALVHQKKSRANKEKLFVEDYSKSVINVSKNDKKITKLLSKETTDGVSDFMDYYQSELSRFDTLFEGYNKEIEDSQNKIDDLRKQMSKLNTIDKHTMTKKAVVKLSCEKETEVTLKLSYRVNQCSWTPIYDVRIVGTEKEFTISYFAQVAQKTGENWEDASISLSTADPNVGAEPPKLNTLTLNYVYPDYGYSNFKSVQKNKSRSGGKRRKKKSSKMDRYLEEEDEEEEEEEEEEVLIGMSSPSARVDKGATSTNFTIERVVNIPSDGFAHKISISTIKLTSELSHYCVPKFDTNVYLKVKATNDSDYPLLPGEMNVFFDNNFIATGVMKSVSPKEEFESYLGVDPSVKVEYRPVKSTSETSGILIGKQRKNTIERKIIIKNTKDLAIKLSLADQFPKSTDETIKVVLLKPELKNTTELKDVKLYGATVLRVGLNADTNNMEWEMIINPGSETTIPFEYSIQWPQDSQLDNYEL